MNEVQNYVVVEDGIVTNTIIWDGNTDPSTGGIPVWPAGWVVFPWPEGAMVWIGYPATQNPDGTWTFGGPDWS